jgi:hypothetical protein
MVEEIQSRAISEYLPQAAANIGHAINSYRDPESDTILRDHGYKASVEMLRATGILPSHTTSTYYQQINSTGDVHITAELAQLQSYLDHQWSQVVEVEPIDADHPISEPLQVLDDSGGGPLD